jgi:hypothetical protein
LSAGLNKKREKIGKSNQRQEFEKQSKQRNKSLPRRDWHGLSLVAPLVCYFPRKGFRPEAFGGRSLARAGIRCRSFVLLALGNELLQKLATGLGLQRDRVLVDLRLGAG